jgi:hypothetical protein
VVYLVILAALVAAFLALNWQALVAMRAQFLQLGVAAEPDPDAALAMISGMFLLFGSVILFLFPFYLATAAYEAACLRWMIRGEAPGLFGFTLGADTWRVYGVYWCWFAVQVVLSLVVSIVTMPVMFATLSQIRDATPETLWRWQMSVQLPISLLTYVPMIVLGVRLGPAAATSILQRQFAFPEAWAVTRDRFWALFGSYALWFAVFAAAWVVMFATPFFVPGGVSWQEYVELMSHPPDPERARELMIEAWRPGRLMLEAVNYAVLALAFVAWCLISFGINARAALAALDEGRINGPSAEASRA